MNEVKYARGFTESETYLRAVVVKLSYPPQVTVVAQSLFLCGSNSSVVNTILILGPFVGPFRG